MKKNIIDIKKSRKKKKSRSYDEIAKDAAHFIFDDLPNDLKEPEAFASGGDMSKISDGNDEDEPIEEDDVNEKK